MRYELEICADSEALKGFRAPLRVMVTSGTMAYTRPPIRRSDLGSQTFVYQISDTDVLPEGVRETLQPKEIS